jgi:ornithine cyclodeaminase/alanine dehydrogenase-like protein (mu-crystallin family)
MTFPLAPSPGPDENEITVFKNGGGAHLDLMCARYILDAVQSG